MLNIVTEKTDFLLEVKHKYTYRIFTNGNGDISFEVQLTKDFEAASLRNFALATTPRENFDRNIDVRHINKYLSILRDNIQEDGRYATIECNYLPKWDL